MLHLLDTAKVSFLNKLIHLVNVGNGAALEVSSSKIVSGLEPLKTNVLLTTFGRLAQDKKIDRNELIQHCLSGKAIQEFQRNEESLSDATNAHGKAADSKATTSPGANVTEQSGANEQHSIMERGHETNSCYDFWSHCQAKMF